MGDEAEQLQVLALTLERLEELRPYPEGLFRVPGPRDEVHELATLLLRNEPGAAREALRMCHDSYTCADALKQWLRTRPLLPAVGEARQAMERAAAAATATAESGAPTDAQACAEDAARAAQDDLMQTISTLSPLSHAVVEALLPLLRKVVNTTSAAMQARSLAICLAPSLFDGSRSAPQGDDATALERQHANATEVNILHCLLSDPTPKEIDDSQPLVFSEVIRAGAGPLKELLRSTRIKDINATLDDKWTLLHWSARLGAHHCAKLLLEHGADVSIGDWGSYNALHVAATIEVTEVLLHCRTACAALGLRNKAGRTALEEHAAEGRTGVAEMLRRATTRMLEARRQRLAWAKAGIHRRLAIATSATPHDQGQVAAYSPPFQWLSDDLVGEVGKRIPLICRQTTADQAAVAAADPRFRSARWPDEADVAKFAVGDGHKCVIQ